MFIRAICPEDAKTFLCLSDEFRGAAFHRCCDANDQGQVRHVLASLDLAPVRPFDPRPSANFFLGFRLPKANSQNGRAKCLGRQRIIRLASSRPTGPTFTLLHWQKRRLSLAATTG